MTALVGTKAWSWRVAPGAAVAFGAITLGAGLATVPLGRLARQPEPHGPLSLLFLVLFLTPGVMVGTLLAARRPRNPIGWMLLAFYLLAENPAGDYAIIDYRLHHGHLPLGSVAVVVLASWPVWLVLIAVLLWVFPDGRLPQARWRRVAVVLVAAGALLAVAATAGGAAAVAGHTVRIDASGNLDISGNLTVAGSKSARVKLQDGREVALYAVESPENWFEDFGTAHLQAGTTRISLEPGFLQTVDTAADYHVFLTPNGDCRGLYIARKTRGDFEVRELRGGNSSVAFDYRIVARRRGFENVRLQDVHLPQGPKDMHSRVASMRSSEHMLAPPPPRVTIPVLPHPAAQGH